MHRHLRRGGILLIKDAGGALVPALPHRRGQILVDRGSHQGMHEPQRPLAFDQPLRHQRADRLGGCVAVQVGQSAGSLGGGRGAEHGDRAGRGQCGGGHPPELKQHAARDRAGGQPPQVRYLGVCSLHALGGQAGQQTPQQQRVASGKFAAGILERRRRACAQRSAYQFRTRRRAQRGRTQRDYARLRGQTRYQRLLLRRP